jgi:hypothetical protein
MVVVSCWLNSEFCFLLNLVKSFGECDLGRKNMGREEKKIVGWVHRKFL